MSLHKDFPITERFRLQFRTDFINAFNHVQYNAPNMSLGVHYGTDYQRPAPKEHTARAEALLLKTNTYNDAGGILLPALFFAVTFQRGIFETHFKMYRYPGKAAAFLAFSGLCRHGPILARSAIANTRCASLLGTVPEKAISLAEQGRCRESISALKHAMAGHCPCRYAETGWRAWGSLFPGHGRPRLR